MGAGRPSKPIPARTTTWSPGSTVVRRKSTSGGGAAARATRFDPTAAQQGRGRGRPRGPRLEHELGARLGDGESGDRRLLEDRGIAQRFEAAFDADWEGRATSGTDAWRLEDPLALLGLYALVAVASAVSLRKLRPGDKGIKPRPRVRTRALIRATLRRRR